MVVWMAVGMVTGETMDGCEHGCARRRAGRRVFTRDQADFFFGVKTSVSSSRLTQPIQ